MDFLPAQARAGPVSSIDRSKAKLLGGGHLAKTTIVSCKDQGMKEGEFPFATLEESTNERR
jgi:hypothetical protein